MLILKYKNRLGEVLMYGGGNHGIMIKDLAGFGTVEFEYESAVYSGCDGQKTLSRRAVPRALTISVDISGAGTAAEVRRIIDVLSEEGTLYISDTSEGGISRRIYCSQSAIPDAERIAAGKIAALTVQFVCDSPYFEDAADTEIPIYRRIKNLSTPFTLPAVFGTTAAENTAFNIGSAAVEPVIAIRFTKTLSSAETVTVTNSTTGAFVSFSYTPHSGDMVKIDIPERRLTSSRLGTITEQLSDDTYLSDFRLERGRNVIGVSVGDAQSGAVVACIFNNKYLESAVI